MRDLAIDNSIANCTCITFWSKYYFILKMARIYIEPKHVAGSNSVKYTINPKSNY